MMGLYSNHSIVNYVEYCALDTTGDVNSQFSSLDGHSSESDKKLNGDHDDVISSWVWKGFDPHNNPDRAKDFVYTVNPRIAANIENSSSALTYFEIFLTIISTVFSYMKPIHTQDRKLVNNQ